jgi:hypothetical protein
VQRHAPAAVPLRSVAAGGACLLLALLCAPPRARADAPPAPPARYTHCSPSRAFCFSSDPERGTWVHPRGEPERATWSLPAWHRIAYLADDGEHLVTGYDGGNLVPLDAPERVEILCFWQRGAARKRHTLGDLGYPREKLTRTVSHYAWGRYDGFDSDGRFRLKMVDGASLLFDPASGELVRRIAPGADGSARDVR